MSLLAGLLGFSRTRLRRQAEAWVVRRDAGPLRPSEQARFDAWLAREGAAEAYVSAEALWGDMDRAAAVAPVQAARLRRWRAVPISRRPIYLAGGTALAATAAVAVVAPDLIVALRADVRTGTAETRVIALEDGSRAILNTRSALDVDYHAGERRIRLLAGEAAFEVAPDAERPFIVEANGGATRALGTVFAVRREGGGALVTAIEHRIAVTRDDETRILSPGEQLRYTRSGAPSAVGRADANASAWRRGVLIFENRPLAEIAGELARYTDTRIVVLGSARSKAFSGVFRTNDPLAGLDAAAKGGKLDLTRLPGLVIVTAR